MIKKVFSSTMARDNIITNLIDVCPDGIIGVDLHGTIVIFNEKAAVLTRRKFEDVIGSLDIGQIYGSREQARQIKTALYAEGHGGVGRLDGFETTIVDIKNKTIPIRLSAALIIENGNEVGSVGFFHDLTYQKIMEEKLRRLSITDGLTNLLNQRHFHSCLLDQSVIVAEKICLMFNDSWPFDISGTAVLSRVTLSMGVVQREDETSGVALMKRADVAMYNAKNLGGNRIVVG
ncbi:MAG: PAS domain-containing protein [Pseudomonadota bacterium]